MQFLALVLLALVSFAQAAAVAERGVNPSLKVASTFCKDTATLVSTKKIQGVRVKQFACNDTTKAAPSPAVNTNTTSLEARQFDACTSTTPGVCQSSVLFEADCDYIDLVATGQNTGTFFTPHDYYNLLTYNTCQFRWGNAGSITLEYAYFNFGNLGSVIYNNRVTVAHGGQGYCVSNDNLWVVETGRPL